MLTSWEFSGRNTMFPFIMETYVKCNRCDGHVEYWYKCRECHDLDFCLNCYAIERHPHKMGFIMKKIRNPEGTPQLSDETRRVYNEALTHTFQCNGCPLETCDFMKKVLKHAKLCGVGCLCPVYALYIDVCVLHAKSCTRTECQVFECSKVKESICQAQLQEALIARSMTANNTFNLNNK